MDVGYLIYKKNMRVTFRIDMFDNGSTMTNSQRGKEIDSRYNQSTWLPGHPTNTDRDDDDHVASDDDDGVNGRDDDNRFWPMRGE